jgi:mannose-6-phosphate isomerase-like protein (cupin superfamily)/DNA-binding XRE family transcriptional regulator
MGDSNKCASRLVSLRRERNLTPGDLAARSGVPEDEIDAIEAGRLSPSIAPLVKLSRALGVRLGTFLDDAGDEGPVVCRKGLSPEVMRASGQVSPKMGAMSFYSLAKGKAGRSMEPFLVDVRPAVGGESSLSTHEGEEFIYVLQGEIEVRYGSETQDLAAGDSIYYDSIVPHRVSARADATTPAKILAVVYAPY